MEELRCRPMGEGDIDLCARLYMDYYNTAEGGQWTAETTRRRIHQVWGHEAALCLLFKVREEVIGFAMGHFEQYDDLSAYDLVEIVLAAPWQNQGLGTACMVLLEKEVRARGGAMIQLQAVNDARHEHFYSKLGYQTCTNLIPKSKFL